METNKNVIFPNFSAENMRSHNAIKVKTSFEMQVFSDYSLIGIKFQIE